MHALSAHACPAPLPAASACLPQYVLHWRNSKWHRWQYIEVAYTRTRCVLLRVLPAHPSPTLLAAGCVSACLQGSARVIRCLQDHRRSLVPTCAAALFDHEVGRKGVLRA